MRAPFRNTNHIFLRNAEDFTSKGYLTGKKIILPETRIEIDLKNNFYRSDGPFEKWNDLVDSVIGAYQMEGFVYEGAKALAAKGRFIHEKDNSGGFVLSRKFSVEGKISYLVTKGTSRKEDVFQQSYLEAHEEGHVLDHLGQLDVLQRWFDDKGFHKIKVHKFAKGPDREYFGCSVGLAHILSQGINLDDANILTPEDPRKELHEELLAFYFN